MRPFLAAAALLFSSWAASAQPVTLSVLTPRYLPAGFTGTSYSQTLVIYEQQYGVQGVWSITGGVLPAGLSLSSSGVISGVPTTAGTAVFGVSVSASGYPTGAGQFTLTIVPGPSRLVITPTDLPQGHIGWGYPGILAASGGVPPYAWEITSGALPSGLAGYPASSGAAPTATFYVDGIPSTTSVTSAFTVRVTDANAATASQAFTVATGQLEMNARLPVAVSAGVPYAQTLTAAGGVLPYTWSLTGGALPVGLTLSPAGVIAGVPSTPETAMFILRVTDATSQFLEGVEWLPVTVPNVVIATPPTLLSGVAGVAYSQTLTATGGFPPYSWQITSGILPPLLALSSAGLISGTPTSAGVSTFTASVTDTSLHTATQAFSLTVTLGALTVTSAATLPAGVVGTAYSQTLAATGGVPPYTWQVTSGTWPAGLSITSAGVITGTPTAGGTYSFTAQVRDNSSATATQSFTLTVSAPPAITTASPLPTASVGAAYSQTLAASAGKPPYAWSVTAGALPGGLTLSASGVLAGTPTAPGTFSFIVQATDAAGATATAGFTLLVTPTGCAAFLNYSGEAFTAAGGAGTVAVSAPSGCPWNAASSLSWVTVTSGASGTGNGVVTFLVAANPGAMRSGVITIAGAPFTVEEARASFTGFTSAGSLAQITSGGYWKATLTLVNTGNTAQEAVVTFYDDNGAPLALPVNFPQAPLAAPELAYSIDRTLNPGAQLLIETVGPDNQPSIAGWAQVQASGSVTGSSVFRWGAPPNQQEAVAQLETRTPSAFLLTFDQTGGYVLGVALANTSPTAANVPATLRDDTGKLIGATTISLPAMGHTAFMLTDKFASVARGSLELTVPAGAPIATIAFRANSQGSLATVLPLVK